MIERLKPRGSSPVLGLSFDGAAVEAVLVRPGNGQAEASAPVTFHLPADILSSDPVAVGRALRESLDKAGLGTRRCAVALPASWVFASSIPLPDLAPEDAEGFVELEVERSFPQGSDQLAIARHEWKDASGLPQITLVAVPVEHLERLEQVLRAARMQPVSIAPALTEMQHLVPSESPARIDFLASPASVALAIGCGEGLVLHRCLDDVVAVAGGQPSVAPDRLQRELRVTLGQLPDAIRQSLARARIFGSGPLADALQQVLAAIAPRLAMSVVRADRVPGNRDASLRITPGIPATAALAIAARHLGGGPASFEFLAPRVSPWQQLATRFSSGRAAHYGLAAAAVVALTAGAFLVQQVRLMSLRSRWDGIAKTAAHVEGLQANLKKYRPWFDESVPSLLVLRTLTMAFPEDGALTAKTVELREGAIVVCSGTAKDSFTLNSTLEKLRTAPEVRDVTVDQMRGKSPVQFSFNFKWDSSAGTP
ncbi:MAG: hypothetical protein WCR07_07760 [Verrucomicrobiota bacterium]|jgi:hypothetical protein